MSGAGYRGTSMAMTAMVLPPVRSRHQGVREHRHSQFAVHMRISYPQDGYRSLTGDGQACLVAAASSRPSSSTDRSRISTLRILPVTVIGKSSTTCTYRGIL